jgi:hypothetical protein
MHRLKRLAPFGLAAGAGSFLTIALITAQHLGNVLAFGPLGYTSDRRQKRDHGAVHTQTVLDRLARRI